MIKVGIIGGSGLDDPKILKNAVEKEIITPYGRPTSALTCGTIEGVEAVLVARHGKNHSIYPGKVNFRANIWALKEEGCTHILASTAVGSLREEIAPGHLVFPSQFIDHTKKRETTFFDEDIVVHTPFAEPFCPNLINLFSSISDEIGLPYHR
ncbi:MAG TPA: MTAP family purine nucleoside phosphorylase, partial [Thermodesulfobacteriota bacterium]|nr:MTAP family purine nucleoside phosphorylase [Thermodesulfobacteriota bacterium]